MDHTIQQSQHVDQGNESRPANALFSPGQVVRHRLFDYVGIIVDVDPIFQSTESWYKKNAKSRPDKNQPWYHILVDGRRNRTYVAESNIESTDAADIIIDHPEIPSLLDEPTEGVYKLKTQIH